jgi:hypothetical protein
MQMTGGQALAQSLKIEGIETLFALPGIQMDFLFDAFWEERDSARHVDWGRAERVRLPSLKPSTTSISLRLPVGLLERIKIAAHKRDVPYQSLVKIFLAERVAQEQRSHV